MRVHVRINEYSMDSNPSDNVLVDYAETMKQWTSLYKWRGGGEEKEERAGGCLSLAHCNQVQHNHWQASSYHARCMRQQDTHTVRCVRSKGWDFYFVALQTEIRMKVEREI